MISVVTVTRNNLEGLIKTYHSLYSQTVQPDQWIIIDGYSEDGTDAFIQNCMLSRKVLYAKQVPSGVYPALEYGLTLVSNSWVQFLNAGDVYCDNDSLSKVIPNLEIHRDKILLFGYFKADRRINPVRPKTARIGTCHQAIIYPVDILRRYPFDVRLKIFADNFQMSQMVNSGVQYLLFDEPVVVFEPGGLSEKHYKKGLMEMRYVWYYRFGLFLGFFAWMLWILRLISRKITNRG